MASPETLAFVNLFGAVYCNILKEMCLVFVYVPSILFCSAQIRYILLLYFSFPGKKFRKVISEFEEYKWIDNDKKSSMF